MNSELNEWYSLLVSAEKSDWVRGNELKKCSDGFERNKMRTYPSSSK